MGNYIRKYDSDINSYIIVKTGNSSSNLTNALKNINMYTFSGSHGSPIPINIDLIGKYDQYNKDDFQDQIRKGVKLYDDFINKINEKADETIRKLSQGKNKEGKQIDITTSDDKMHDIKPYIDGKIYNIYSNTSSTLYEANKKLTDILTKLDIKELYFKDNKIKCKYNNIEISLDKLIMLLNNIKNKIIEKEENHDYITKLSDPSIQDILSKKYYDTELNSDGTFEDIQKIIEYNKSIYKKELYNEINRVKDARINTCKQIAFLTGTGQVVKHKMVVETISLYNTLYNSIDFKLQKPKDLADDY